jgi:phage terminase large subunit
MAKQIINFENFYDCISPHFWEAIENENKIRILKGGAGSGKSYTIFSQMIYDMVVNACNHLVVRQTAASNRTSTFALTKQIINKFGLSDFFKENKSEMSFLCKINGSMVYFRGLEGDVDRLKSLSFPGASGILERVIFEEASEGNIESVIQLLLRMRGESKNYFQMTLLLNPVSAMNYIKKYFYDSNEYKAYKHNSTYKDNIFIDEFYGETLESLKKENYNMYRIYALGEWGISEGKIFNNYEAMSFPFDRENIDSSEILAGCDWGYNHPTCLTLSYIKDNILYTFDELVAYESTNTEFIKLVEEFDFISKNQRVIYDSEDPARGKEFINHGYSFIGAKKGKGSVLRTIDYIKSFDRWYVDSDRCPRLMQELEQYAWRKDKDGNPMDEPIAIMDDAISAVRYSIEHLAHMKGKPGVLSGSISDQKKGIIEIKKAQRRQMKEVLKAQRKKKKSDIENFIEK